MSRFWTSEEIESEVDKVSGTWVKRRNLWLKLKAENNNFIDTHIEIIKRDIRRLKAMGTPEGLLLVYYSEITDLELRRL
jgi:hypothetical protein